MVKDTKAEKHGQADVPGTVMSLDKDERKPIKLKVQPRDCYQVNIHSGQKGKEVTVNVEWGFSDKEDLKDEAVKPSENTDCRGPNVNSIIVRANGGSASFSYTKCTCPKGDER